MKISKGAPLKAFSVMTFVWISVRIIWEAIFPASDLGTVEAAEVEMAVVSSQPAKLSLPVVMLSQERGSVQKSVQGGPHPKTRTSLLATTFAAAQLPVNNSAKTTTEEAPAAPRHQVSSSLAGAISAPSSNPISGYFWLFARQSNRAGSSGTTLPVLQSPGGQYGGSQAGAILTYRLTGTAPQHLSAFVRASAALAEAGQEELAIGLSARPFAKIPLSLFAEKRLGARDFNKRGTAIYVAGGTGPEELLPQTSLETYAQAGYVFADDSSYFFDASASVQRKLWERGDYKLTAGAGAWAGGQEGLTRFDIGPRANVHVPVGKSDMRFSLDWRQRIGGNAVPDSGVALTISSGF